MPRAERSFRTPALILKRRDFNESDRLLTILTPHRGKLDVLAKGARKPTNSKVGHVELFTRADMLIHSGREIGIAEQAVMVMPYVPLREDLTRGAYASYAAELADRFITEGEDDLSRAFTLFDDTLARLCDDSDPRLVVRYYELHLLNLVGFRPELFQCVIGHEPVVPQDQFFSCADGGVICPAHLHKNLSVVPIPMVTLKLLRHMQRSSYAKVKTLTITPALHDDAERVLLGYISFLLERKVQSVEFIKRLRRL